MTKELETKIQKAVKLLKLIPLEGGGRPMEVAYSGGKDSDVILQLAKESGIKFEAYYKMTTIDPPGTILHAKEMGAIIVNPKKSFFQLIDYAGFPNRYHRFCCAFLKEYSLGHYNVIMGVRKAESRKRNERYKEPVECRVYSHNERIQAIYPILEWTDQDVADFIADRNIKCHPLYYREDGTFDVTKRLGCLCCPLQSKNKRLQAFMEHPNMVKLYIKHGQIYRDTHPDAKVLKYSDDIYQQFVRDVFYNTSLEFESEIRNSIFGKANCKTIIEEYFNIKLN